MGGNILVINQGTTSTRAIVFDGQAKPLASAMLEFPRSIPIQAGSSTIPRTSGARR